MGHLAAYAHHATEVWSSRTHNLWAVAALATIYAVPYACEAPQASAQAPALSVFASDAAPSRHVLAEAGGGACASTIGS